jgi:hypothetical protein
MRSRNLTVGMRAFLLHVVMTTFSGDAADAIVAAKNV